LSRVTTTSPTSGIPTVRHMVNPPDARRTRLPPGEWPGPTRCQHIPGYRQNRPRFLRKISNWRGISEVVALDEPAENPIARKTGEDMTFSDILGHRPRAEARDCFDQA